MDMFQFLRHLSWLYILDAFAAICFFGVIRRSWAMGKRDPNAPPGPPTFPIIGNLLDMPKGRLHLAFSKWGKSMSTLILLGD